MAKLTYKEIEDALLEMDEIPERDEKDKPGDYVDYLLQESCGSASQIWEYLSDNGFSNKSVERKVEFDEKKLKLIKAVLKEIQDAYCSLDKEKDPTMHYFAYPIFGQWGLLSFNGVGKHPHFSDDGIEYASGYPLRIIAGIEKCLKKRKKAA